MRGVALKLDTQVVNDYLEEHKLTEGGSGIEAICLQMEGMQSGQPAVLIVGEVDGKKVLFKTSLNMMIAATGGLRSRAESLGWKQPP